MSVWTKIAERRDVVLAAPESASADWIRERIAEAASVAAEGLERLGQGNVIIELRPAELASKAAAHGYDVSERQIVALVTIRERELAAERERDRREARAPDNVVPIGTKAKRARKAKAHGGERTELQLAELLVQRFGGELRYCAAFGGWHAWDGTRWAPDLRERARECVKAIAHDLARDALELKDVDTFRAAKRAGSAGGVAAILDLARSTPGIVFTPDEADADPWALNTPSGVVDLRTGAVRPHRQEELHTRATGTAYDPAATAPTFDRFLSEIAPNADVRAYLARLFGYAAAGVVREHVLGVLWGSGANGKSVLAECVMHALGSYARPGPSSLVVANGQHDPHPTDVASCVGSRLVVVHETKRGASFDASKVKLLTGGDRLTARHMREDFFTFAPSHTLLMLSNYRPAADASDSALWRRVHLVLFGVVIPEERRDTSLAERIVRDELPGVLAWIVRGCLEWQRIGLAPPTLVREQTASYRASEDVVAAFLEDRCTVLRELTTPAQNLYDAFRVWCTANGHRVLRVNDFADEITGRGIERKRTAAGNVYVGIGLRSEDSEDRRG